MQSEALCGHKESLGTTDPSKPSKGPLRIQVTALGSHSDNTCSVLMGRCGKMQGESGHLWIHPRPLRGHKGSLVRIHRPARILKMSLQDSSNGSDMLPGSHNICRVLMGRLSKMHGVSGHLGMHPLTLYGHKGSLGTTDPPKPSKGPLRTQVTAALGSHNICRVLMGRLSKMQDESGHLGMQSGALCGHKRSLEKRRRGSDSNGDSNSDTDRDSVSDSDGHEVKNRYFIGQFILVPDLQDATDVKFPN
jgi:hypothetical protein